MSAAHRPNANSQSSNPRRQPVVSFYDASTDYYNNFDWTTFAIPPPVLLHQMFIGHAPSSSTQKALWKDLDKFKSAYTKGIFEGISVVSDNPELAQKVEVYLRNTHVEFIEIRLRVLHHGSEYSTIYDRRSGRELTGTFLSMSVDDVPKLADIPLNLQYSTGPRIVRFTLPDPFPKVFHTATAVNVKKAMRVLRQQSQLQKCTAPADFFLDIDDLLYALQETPSCDELELMPPISGDILRPSRTRSDYIRKLVAGVQQFQHLRVLTVPLRLVDVETLPYFAALPNLQVLRIRKDYIVLGHPASYILQVVQQVAERWRNHQSPWFQSLQLFNVVVDENMGVDVHRGMELQRYFQRVNIYQSFDS